MDNILYVRTNSRSSRNIEAWLKENEVEYIKRNVDQQPPSVEELMEMLRRTNNGLDDIVLEHSTPIKNLGRVKNNLSLKDMLCFLHENPSAIKVPLLFTKKHFIRGYREEELRKVLPRHKKLEVRASLYESIRKGVPYKI